MELILALIAVALFVPVGIAGVAGLAVQSLTRRPATHEQPVILQTETTLTVVDDRFSVKIAS